MKVYARRCQGGALGYLLHLVALVLLLAPVPGIAGPTGLVVRVVQNDRGGVVGVRVQEIAQLQKQRHRVEIRGNVCLSTCTMYLGAQSVCVDPNTKFGFHGPSYYGRPLKPQQFEYWSQVIGSYYPEKLRKWYMSTGRYKSEGYYTISGAQLIRMGVDQC